MRRLWRGAAGPDLTEISLFGWMEMGIAAWRPHLIRARPTRRITQMDKMSVVLNDSERVSGFARQELAPSRSSE